MVVLGRVEKPVTGMGAELVDEFFWEALCLGDRLEDLFPVISSAMRKPPPEERVGEYGGKRKWDYG